MLTADTAERLLEAEAFLMVMRQKVATCHLETHIAESDLTHALDRAVTAREQMLEAASALENASRLLALTRELADHERRGRWP